MLSICRWAFSASTRAFSTAAFWMAIPAPAVVFLLLKSFSAWTLAVLGGVQRNLILPRGNGRQNRILADFQLRLSSRRRRWKASGSALLRSMPGRPLGLDHLLLGFRQVGLGFAQVVFLGVVSNSTTTSPGFTGSPGSRR